ncbi:MAG: hypothetical protein EXS16_19825 [Gemmataceae bacterium]|nr:hypothetical protein [Gemmataceae bacterium]
MKRFGFYSLFIVVTCALAVAAGNPAEDNEARFQKTLAVQNAMVQARTLLSDMLPQKAVDVLEQNLPNVNSNSAYLVLLRDAYRSNIRDHLLAGRPELAKRYLDRLCILEPMAAKDATLQPSGETPPRNFEREPAKQTKSVFPKFGLPILTNPFAKKNPAKEPSEAPSPSVVRAVPDTDDPFDKKHQRAMPTDPTQVAVVRDLLTRGETEFQRARYSEARYYFEQAYEKDRTSLDACREQWAYCIIKGVADSMDKPGVLPAKLPQLRQQVESAIGMAPAKVSGLGKDVLQQLERRVGPSGERPPIVSANLTKVSHLGQNATGWQVAQSQHFRIFHKQDAEYAERIAQIAEATRANMFRKWFDVEGEAWTPICEMILHPNVGSYTHMTPAPTNSPGHSRIESDASGRVLNRWVHLRLDITNMAETVLPHETTHVVLAGMFDNFAVPRWADEGIAVLSEPSEKIDQHRQNLVKAYKESQQFGLKELMELKDYPQPRRIGAFYAQSVVLVEYLTAKRDGKAFTDFMRDGLRHGYANSLEKHYGLTFQQLEQSWQRDVLANSGVVAARQ